MNDTQITLIQQSFAGVVPIKAEAAAIFYDHLFAHAPEVRPLFKGDLSEQGTKLMAMLGAVVNGLRDLDRIVPVAEKLAVDHVEYGVTAAQYEPVGAALLHTLETGLGDAFTLDVREAWIEAYTILSGVMIDAAYSEGADA
ncbi:nitric oxide dioxygenase [Aliiruegeria haliotis]|uniref:Nitric oxide dioxygenase n=1 Tax=Aliiruegeria haliotis TaxID=1280846 RepID=A0A2T0RJT0_9RHOB|nr:globin family protein [Aliiruegeria haliotis]PRY21418.1 nitric oxide dioxygenase [Aliiruegeria haliotis]